MEIKTNEKLNETVKDTLKMRGDNMSLYALKRIEELEQLALCNVSNQRELLIAYEKNHYTPQEWALASEQCIEDIDNFLAINCC